MELDEKTIGMWFVSLCDGPGGPCIGDWNGTLRIDEGDSLETATRIRLEHRFRYYDPDDPDDPDNDPWSGKDRKKWYGALIDVTEERPASYAIGVMDEIAETFALLSGTSPDRILMGEGGIGAFIEELQSKSWSHMRAVPTE